ncbi:MAG: hypothetical protein AVDCRST_MAG27-3544, partial [uncultured Craurococcus sp.]
DRPPQPRPSRCRGHEPCAGRGRWRDSGALPERHLPRESRGATGRTRDLHQLLRAAAGSLVARRRACRLCRGAGASGQPDRARRRAAGAGGARRIVHGRAGGDAGTGGCAAARPRRRRDWAHRPARGSVSEWRTAARAGADAAGRQCTRADLVGGPGERHGHRLARPSAAAAQPGPALSGRERHQARRRWAAALQLRDAAAPAGRAGRRRARRGRGDELRHRRLRGNGRRHGLCRDACRGPCAPAARCHRTHGHARTRRRGQHRRGAHARWPRSIRPRHGRPRRGRQGRGRAGAGAASGCM